MSNQQVVDSFEACFEDMNLKEELLSGIYAYGFKKPCALQQRALLPCVEGHDVFAQAYSGTGKTASLCISILQQIDTSIRECQALVLTPTRFLAQEIQKVITALGDFMQVQCHTCIGGTDIREDMCKLKAGNHVVVGTSGRVYDMIKRQSLCTNSIKLFALDGLEEFKASRGKLSSFEQIDKIFKTLPAEVQMILFCASMNPVALHVSTSFMKSPMRISVEQKELKFEGIRELFIHVERKHCKFEQLCDLNDTLSITRAVIFCNKVRTVRRLEVSLHDRDYTVFATHRVMEENERDVIREQFLTGSSGFLITTDVGAFNNRVRKVPLVINYDLPSVPEKYMYRIGCGVQFGRKGLAINFVTDDDKHMLKCIEEFYDTHIDKMPTNVADLV